MHSDPHVPPKPDGTSSSNRLVITLVFANMLLPPTLLDVDATPTLNELWRHERSSLPSPTLLEHFDRKSVNLYLELLPLSLSLAKALELLLLEYCRMLGTTLEYADFQFYIFKLLLYGTA